MYNLFFKKKRKSLINFQMQKYIFKEKTLSENESMLNHIIVWPIFEIVVMENNLKFIPGEKLLNTTDEAYQSDGVIVVGNVFEVCILETSGKYNLVDHVRFGYDHVKGAFAALSMIKKKSFKNFTTQKNQLLKI